MIRSRSRAICIDRLSAALRVDGVFAGRPRKDPVGGEVGLEVAGLDHRHAYSEGLDLDAQRFAHGFEGVLGGRVEALEGQRQAAAERAHVDDQARALPPQGGQRGPTHPVHTEDVRVEQRLRLLGQRVLHRAGHPHTCVVDHHVESALAGEHEIHPRAHRVVVADVHWNHTRSVARLSRIGDLGVPAGSIHAVPVQGQVLRAHPAEAGRRARDENDL
jgi:hypothetical protein